MGDRPTMLGHSLGGWIVAWQALARPARTGPIVLVAPAGMLFSPPPVEVTTLPSGPPISSSWPMPPRLV